MRLVYFFFFLNIVIVSKAQQDTVKALVVTSKATSNLGELNDLNGEQIISFIDSLLELDSVPEYLINEVKDYSEERKLKEDIYIALTGYYDSSIYPSGNMYKTWDTYNLYPNAEFEERENEFELVLQDTLNFCNFYNPYKGLITSNFGWRKGRPHNGIDIDLEVNDPVVVAFDGMVRIARNHNGYGRVVIVRHYNGLETLYAHLHRIKVKAGQIVQAGEVIGLGGSSGRSTGSHLHFEVRYKGKALNPKSLIDFNNNSLRSDAIKLIKTKHSFAVIPNGLEYHEVTKGESLYKIAERYGTTINRLCTINSISRNKPLRVGQKIMIDI